MQGHSKRRPTSSRRGLATVCALGGLAWIAHGEARAQPAAPQPDPDEQASETAPPPAEPAPIPPGTAPPKPVPPAFPPAIPNIDFGGRLRIGALIQGQEDPEKLDDVGMTVEADFILNGQVTPILKWTVIGMVA